jgi:hypothetical protein
VFGDGDVQGKEHRGGTIGHKGKVVSIEPL